MNENKTTLDVSGETAPSGNVMQWNSLALTEKLHINLKPSYTITIGNANGEIGRLDFNGPKLIFTGDAEESAKAFLDWLTLSWGKRLQEEREAERKACELTVDSLIISGPVSEVQQRHNWAYMHARDAIRARGEQEKQR